MILILLMEDIPAPVEVGSLSPLFTGVYTSQVVHEFFQHHFFKDLGPRFDKRNRFLGICFFVKSLTLLVMLFLFAFGKPFFLPRYMQYGPSAFFFSGDRMI